MGFTGFFPPYFATGERKTGPVIRPIGSQEGKKPDEALKIGMALQTKAGCQGVGGGHKEEPKLHFSKQKYGG